MDNDTEINSSLLLSRAKTALKSVIGILIAALIVYILILLGTSMEVEKLGQTGDFFGGILNPAVGLATIFLIFVSIQIQKKELDLVRRQMTEQSFQDSFFRWLDTYNHVVQGTTTPAMFGGYRGLNALRAAYSQNFSSENVYSQMLDSLGDNAGSLYLNGELEGIKIRYAEELIIQMWRKMRSDNEDMFSPPLRSIFGLIRWISHSTDITADQKQKYIAILAAQLSAFEVKLVFLECINSERELIYMLGNAGFFLGCAPINDGVISYLVTWKHFVEVPSTEVFIH